MYLNLFNLSLGGIKPTKLSIIQLNHMIESIMTYMFNKINDIIQQNEKFSLPKMVINFFHDT